MRNIRFFAALIALILFGSPFAWSACQTTSVGTICQPLISAITNPTASSIQISWLPGGGVPPQSVKLVKGGTAARSFLDGQVLASATEASSLGNYSSYAFTLNNLGVGTTLSPLYVVGIWGSYSLPSAVFSAATSAPTQTYTTPSITAATVTNGVIALAWYSGSKTYDFYNVRWSSGTAVSLNANQNKVDGGSPNGSFSTKPSGSGPYTFSVEGCISNFFGLASSTCSHWAQPVTVTVPAH